MEGSSSNQKQSEYLLQNDKDNIAKASAARLRREGIIVLIGGICIHLVLGTFLLWGAISIYVASYLRSFDKSVDIGLLAGVFPFTGLGLNVGLLFGLHLAERFGHRLVTAVGILIFSSTVFVTSYITNFAVFVLIYGFLNGLCSGTVYMIPVICGWKYFPNNKGLVSGVTIGAFGFGAFIFNFVAASIANPTNLSPTLLEDGYKYFDSEVYDRVPPMFRILSVCYVILGLAGTLLIKYPKGHSDKINDISETGDVRELLASKVEEGCKSVKEGVLSKPFASLFVMIIGGAFFSIFMASNYKVYGLTKISDDHFITFVGSIGSVCNGGTRAVWALLFDKFGFKRVFAALLILQCLLAPTLNLISSSKPLYMIWFGLIMACEGGHFALFPSVTAKIFGLKYGPKIYGYLFAAFTITNFLGFFSAKLALDIISWQTLFFIALGFTLISLFANFTFKEKYTPKL